MSDALTNARLRALAAAAKSHFELFGLPVQYPLDRPLLSTRYLDLTRATHPDVAGVCAGDPDAQIQAMELSARVNEAHAILDDDLRRAEYLLELRAGAGEGAGGQVPATQLSPDLLERIFEMREALSLAQSSEDEAAAEAIRAEAATWLQHLLSEAGALLDANQPAAQVAPLLAAARYLRKIATA